METQRKDVKNLLYSRLLMMMIEENELSQCYTNILGIINLVNILA